MFVGRTRGRGSQEGEDTARKQGARCLFGDLTPLLLPSTFSLPFVPSFQRLLPAPHFHLPPSPHLFEALPLAALCNCGFLRFPMTILLINHAYVSGPYLVFPEALDTALLFLLLLEAMMAPCSFGWCPAFLSHSVFLTCICVSCRQKLLEGRDSAWLMVVLKVCIILSAHSRHD